MGCVNRDEPRMLRRAGIVWRMESLARGADVWRYVETVSLRGVAVDPDGADWFRCIVRNLQLPERLPERNSNPSIRSYLHFSGDVVGRVRLWNCNADCMRLDPMASVSHPL